MDKLKKLSREEIDEISENCKKKLLPEIEEINIRKEELICERNNLINVYNKLKKYRENYKYLDISYLEYGCKESGQNNEISSQI